MDYPRSRPAVRLGRRPLHRAGQAGLPSPIPRRPVRAARSVARDAHRLRGRGRHHRGVADGAVQGVLHHQRPRGQPRNDAGTAPGRPARIDGPGRSRSTSATMRKAMAVRCSAPLAEYRPNHLRAADAPGAVFVVVKDSVFPGWEATLNGAPGGDHPGERPGTRRGHPVGRPPRGHDVVPPPSFVSGVILATVTPGVVARAGGLEQIRTHHLLRPTASE